MFSVELFPIFDSPVLIRLEDVAVAAVVVVVFSRSAPSALNLRFLFVVTLAPDFLIATGGWGSFKLIELLVSVEENKLRKRPKRRAHTLVVREQLVHNLGLGDVIERNVR